MLARVVSGALHGIEAFPVTVEVEIRMSQLSGWNFAGLPEVVVRESKDRVSAALRNTGYQIRFRRVTVNLAPARRRTQGNAFDLPIAIGLLSAGGVIPPDRTDRFLFAGELLLSGDLHAIRGALSVALLARALGRIVVLPKANAAEIAAVPKLAFVAADSLRDIVTLLQEDGTPDHTRPTPLRPTTTGPDLSDVRGNPIARRMLEIAAAGDHHLMMMGPPGVGKSMLAQRLPGILPPLTHEEAIETTRIYSASGEPLPEGFVTQRPFRMPHHSATAASLAGGGNPPVAGELSLAHNGVLFLDELPEFRRDAIEILRQPLETRTISVSRVGYRVRYPAHFLAVAAANPCRCGYYTHPTRPCECSMRDIQSYRSKLSGPLIDRIDLHTTIGPVDLSALESHTPGESSAVVRARVLAARARQLARYGTPVLTNGRLTAAQTRRRCRPHAEALRLLLLAMEKLGLSARSYDRILRVGRTIADMAGEETIAPSHIQEAITFRRVDG